MVGHYTVSPALPPGLSLDGQSGVISGTPTLTSESAIYMVNASGAGVRASFPLVLSATEPQNHLSWRTQAGAELDLLLFLKGRRIGIEIKRADAPKMTRSMGFWRSRIWNYNGC